MKYKVSLNGQDYLVEVERGDAILVDVQPTPAPVVAAPAAVPASAPVQAPAAPAAAAPAPGAAEIPSGAEAVNAPMNGLILSVNVTEGAAVKAGETLCILEAMKMENEISCPRDGKVLRVVTAKGSHVENGDLLFVIE